MNTKTTADLFPMPEMPQIESEDVREYMAPPAYKVFCLGCSLASIGLHLKLVSVYEVPTVMTYGIGLIFVAMLVFSISWFFVPWERHYAQNEAWKRRIVEAKLRCLESEYPHLSEGDRLVKVRDAMKAWEELGRPGW